MTSPQTQAQDRHKKDQAKEAIALAMQGRWPDAVELNQAILADSPDDLEAYNRLGKALSEIGRVREAMGAFRHALALSPHNPIARKNLDRLEKIDDGEPPANLQGSAAGHTFIEETGKTVVTSLVNLAPPKVLLKQAPGHKVQIRLEAGVLKVTGLQDFCLGQIEPKLAGRLVRLIKAGNRYEAAVRSVGEQELSVIVREVYKHPSQAGAMSFPPKEAPARGVAVPGPSEVLGPVVDDKGAEPVPVKDWSSDDTEPGDDDAFGAVVHRIISAGPGGGEAGEDA